jgi:replicative DNA helicase
VGTQKGLPVLYLALSESAHEITERMLLLESGVDRARLRDARLRTKDWLALGKAISRIHDGEIFIDDTPCQTTADIRIAARTTLNAYGLALIIIDRLELVCGDASSDSWAKGRSKVALELKAIATEFAVPVVGLSRLPDDVGSQSPRRPEIDESILGGFHEDSDAILLIEDNRKAEGDSESEEFPGIPRTVRIRCLKTKSGHTGSIEIGKISLGMA